VVTLLVDSEFFVLLRVVLVQFLKAVGQKADATAGDRAILVAFLAVVLVVDSLVNGVVALLRFDDDQLRREKLGFQFSFIVEALFFGYLVVQYRLTLERLDEAEKPRYWIYVICTAFLSVVAILARAMEGFMLNFALLVIPEVAIMTVQFVYLVIMIYLHWPRDSRRLGDYVDAAGWDLGTVKGGESLVE
jgi:hypothetical protein